MKYIALVTLFAVSAIAGACAPPPYFKSLQVKLIDASTGKQISNRSITILRNGKVRCVRAPCPSKQVYWRGQSDPTGYIQIPRRAYRYNNTIKVEGYQELVIRSLSRRTRFKIELAPVHNGRGKKVHQVQQIRI